MATGLSAEGVTFCKGCSAPLRWVPTAKGRKMPVEAAPVTVDGWTEKATLLYRLDGTRVTPDAWGWMYGHRPHWGSCSEAKQFQIVRSGRK